MEHELSPQHHLARIGAPMVILWTGKPVQGIFAQGYNHYEIAESFAKPYGPVGRAALEQMKLARS